MANLKETQNKILSKIEAIKKINDEPNKSIDKISDKYLKDLPSTDKFSNKLDALKNSRLSKKQNNENIFDKLVTTSDSFLGYDKINKNYNDANFNQSSLPDILGKSRIKKHAVNAADITLRSTRDILLNNIRKTFFTGDGVCGANSIIPIDTVSLSPKEFDILNILTINPATSVGKTIYEPSNTNLNKQKVNRNLYQSFSSGPYNFTTDNNKTLFTATWNSGTQKYNFSGLLQTTGVTVENFLIDYYSSIEMPDITAVTKNAMLLTVQGDGSENVDFTKAQNKMNRVINKVCAICSQQTNTLENQDAVNQFNSDDLDLSYYFDFNNTDGIDIDDEDARLRKVMRFSDCNNFEMPVNTDIFRDFIYLTDKKNLDDLLDTMLRRTASDAFEQSGGGITLDNFNVSLLNSYISNIPKALISSILNPKTFLPITIVYKLFKSIGDQFMDVENLVYKLRKLFYGIIGNIFWKFITEFWKFVKKDLLKFLKGIVSSIIKRKYKRYVVIIGSLIALLKKISKSNLKSCDDLFSTILDTINLAISSNGGFNAPGILLGLAAGSAGYSQDRSFMNISERLDAYGIPTGPINGESNDLLYAVRSIIDGHTEEMDANSFVKASNEKVTIPTPAGPVIIPPGIINVAGKMF